MVNQVLLERILADIQTNVKELRDAKDITWDVYRTNVRARRFVERTLHITIEGCIDPNVAKAGGLQSQGVKGEAVIGYRDPLTTRDLESSSFPGR